MDGIEDSDLPLMAEVTLSREAITSAQAKASGHVIRTRNISMATCFPLSWKLLIYALDTLFVASDKTPKPKQLGKHQNHDLTWAALTRKSTFPATCKARVERTGTGVYPGKCIAILSPELAMIRPERVRVHPFPSNKDKVLFQGSARKNILHKVCPIETKRL